MVIPLVDLPAQAREIEEEILPEIQELFRNGEFIGGKPVAAFENAYAEYLQTRYCVGVGNGTDALELALRAVGVISGSEVIVPVNTFIATAEAVLRIGATPVFVDVDETYLLIDPECVEAAVTPSTSAIVPVHLYGQVAPIEALIPIARRAGAAIVEDAAQSQGATRFGQSAGTLGLIAATSFYPGKNLGAAGDAGAVMTNDAALARSVRLLSTHGSPEKYVHETIGFNSRMDTLQAVVLSAKLRRLDAWNARRREAAERYHSMLCSIEGVVTPVSAPGNSDVWHLYVVRVDHRDAVLRRLQDCGVGAGIHYPQPLHRTRALSKIPTPRGGFPVAERSAARILSLPLHPHITGEQQERIVEVLRAAIRGDSL